MARHSNEAQSQVPSRPVVALPAGEVEWLGFTRAPNGDITTHILATRDGMPVAVKSDLHRTVNGARVDSQVQVAKMLQALINPLARRP